MKILLAEDDAETAAWLARGLGGEGHAVDALPDGREALTKSTVSCSTWSKGVIAGLLLNDFGVQRIAQGVGEQGQGGDKNRHRQCGA